MPEISLQLPLSLISDLNQLKRQANYYKRQIDERIMQSQTKLSFEDSIRLDTFNAVFDCVNAVQSILSQELAPIVLISMLKDILESGNNQLLYSLQVFKKFNNNVQALSSLCKSASLRLLANTLHLINKYPQIFHSLGLTTDSLPGYNDETLLSFRNNELSNFIQASQFISHTHALHPFADMLNASPCNLGIIKIFPDAASSCENYPLSENHIKHAVKYIKIYAHSGLLEKLREIKNKQNQISYEPYYETYFEYGWMKIVTHADTVQWVYLPNAEEIRPYILDYQTVYQKAYERDNETAVSSDAWNNLYQIYAKDGFYDWEESKNLYERNYRAIRSEMLQYFSSYLIELKENTSITTLNLIEVACGHAALLQQCVHEAERLGFTVATKIGIDKDEASISYNKTNLPNDYLFIASDMIHMIDKLNDQCKNHAICLAQDRIHTIALGSGAFTRHVLQGTKHALIAFQQLHSLADGLILGGLRELLLTKDIARDIGFTPLVFNHNYAVLKGKDSSRLLQKVLGRLSEEPLYLDLSKAADPIWIIENLAYEKLLPIKHLELSYASFNMQPSTLFYDLSAKIHQALKAFPNLKSIEYIHAPNLFEPENSYAALDGVRNILAGFCNSEGIQFIGYSTSFKSQHEVPPFNHRKRLRLGEAYQRYSEGITFFNANNNNNLDATAFIAAAAFRK